MNIERIQREYKDLLKNLYPMLKKSYSLEALDEINIFWYRRMDVVKLYLRYMFNGEESYVFTAATFLDYDNYEHIPFLLMGKKHVLDDPLAKYAEICGNVEIDNVKMLYEQLVLTVEDNIKILDNCNGHILILPLRLLNQCMCDDTLYNIGQKLFLSFFDDIDTMEDYFVKCITIQDIVKHLSNGIEKVVRFSENDNVKLTFRERYNNALIENKYMLKDDIKAGENFYNLVYGCIQQALDVIVSCMEYKCIPYIRYPVALHYVAMLLDSFDNIEFNSLIKFKMSIAFVVHYRCDKSRFNSINLCELLGKDSVKLFNEKLYNSFQKEGITKDTYMAHSIDKIVDELLEEIYNDL